MYQYPDYLMHYGVLGMKWGQRKAAKYAAKASKAQRRGNTAKAREYSKKSKFLTEKHTGRAGSQAVYKRIQSQSTARLVGKSLLMGTYGTLNYERVRSRGAGKGESFVAGLGSTLASNYLTGGLAGIIEPRITREVNRSGREGVKK